VSAEASYARQIIAELEAIEFDSGSAIRLYTEKVRRLSRALAMELEYSAQELEAALKELPPGAGEGQLTARRKARAVARHLRRSAEAQRNVGIEAVRTWGSLAKHYEHLVKPRKRRKTLNLNV
jgi:hypothetical protein